MKRSLKALGLALVALVALGAVAASAASAHSFDSEISPIWTSGKNTNNHVFTTSVGTVTCTSATFKGTNSGTEAEPSVFTSATTTVHPVYSGCTAFGFGASVETTGCNYKFGITEEVGGIHRGPVSIECEAGKKIKILAAFCTMEVPGSAANQNLSHVNYTSEGSGSGRTVNVESAVTGISYEGNCGSGTTGEYAGKANVKGYTDSTEATQKGVWIT